MIIGYILVGLLGVLSVILLTGHGAFLIAGYNTSSPEERAKYDAKKLCRTIGVTLLLVTAGTAGLLLIPSDSAFSTPYFIFFFLLIFADIGGTLYYSNKRCYKKGYKADEKGGAVDNEYLKEGKNDAKKEKPVALIAGICIVVLPVILLVSITLYQASQPPVFTVNDSTLKISSAYGETISRNGIKSLQLKDSLPEKLSKTCGSDFGSILKGKFNADGKEAEVYLDAAKPPFLYIETTDGLIILNDQSKAKTEALYHELKTTKQ